MNAKAYPLIDSVEKLEERLKNVKSAQKEYAEFPQEKVDEIFKAAAMAANKARIPLEKLAVEETGMGVVEDKVIKNNYASEYIYNAYKNTKTCGVIEEDEAYGIKKIGGAGRGDCGGDSHNQSDLYGNLQNAACLKNPQRYGNQPASQSEEKYDRSSKNCA